MLSSSSSPQARSIFLNRDGQESASKVRESILDYDLNINKYVAKKFVGRLLAFDKRLRYTAEEASADPWLCGRGEAPLTKPVISRKRPRGEYKSMETEPKRPRGEHKSLETEPKRVRKCKLIEIQ